MKLKFILILFIILIAKINLAQHPYFYKIDDENGLPSNEVYEVLQDDFGYMWIGCDAGLYRYDGFKFTGYTNSKQNGKAISYLRKDTKGRIWCKNFNGQIYRVEGDSLKIIIDNSGLESAAAQFTLDEGSNLWIANQNKIEKYDENGKTFQIVYQDTNTTKKAQFSEIIYHNKSIYFSNLGSGICELNTKTNLTKTYSTFFSDNEIYNRFSFTSNNNELFILAENQKNPSFSIFKLKGKLIQQAIYKVSENNNRAYTLRFDKENQPWLCTSNGAFQQNNSQSSLEQSNAKFNGQKISFMFHDKEGNYWFTSLHNGIFIIPYLQLQNYTNSNSSLPTNNISAITHLKDKQLLAGTYLGQILRLNANHEFEVVADKTPNQYTTVKKILETEDYIYTSRVIMSVIDKKTLKEIAGVRMNSRDFIIHNDTLYSISYGSFSCIALKDLHRGLSEKHNYIRKIGGRTLYFDSLNNQIYVAFNDGLFSYQNKQFKEVLFNQNHVYAHSIATYKNEAWIATSNNSLLKLTNGKITKQGINELNIKESIIKLVVQKKNFLFITTSGNFYIHDINNKKTHVYSSMQGINSRDITAIDIENEIVYLATNKGITTLPINLTFNNNYKSNIKIQSVLLGDQKIILDSVLLLPYKNNNLKINFTSVAFKSRGQFTYEYRLIGLDTNWTINKGSDNYAVFSSLPPGNFQFEVRSRNENGILSNQTLSFKIAVESPFWQKWWFYLFIIVATIGVVTLVFLIRIRTIQKKSAIQQELATSQLAAINAQMNPHFMYNTLNSIQDLILKSDLKNTNYYLSKFSSLMRKILEASQSNTIILEEEIEILELYLSLEKLRFGNEFTYEINCETTINKSKILIPSIIIQPFVENAIKHGLLHKKENKKIEISFTEKDKFMICTISDNGIGRKKSAEIKERSAFAHKSFATKATEKRLALINSDKETPITLKIIDLESNGIPSGTQVIISIPL